MSKKLGDNWCALLCVAAATTAPLLFGLMIGGGGSSKDTFVGSKGKTTHTDPAYMFPEFSAGLFAALMSVGAMIGSLMGGQLAERLGRKWTMILMAPVYALSFIVTLFAQGGWMVHAGRFISGLAIGVNCTAAPVYIAEISPDHLRGALGACNQLMICFGIMAAWGFANFKIQLENDDEDGKKEWFDWKLFNYLMFIPTVLMMGGMILAPETPRWLASKGRLTEAKRVLSRIRGGKASQAEMESLDNIAIKSAGQGSVKSNRVSMADLQACKRPLTIALVLQICQQFSGINGVMNYMGSMYALAELDPETWGFVLTLVQFIVTLIACFMIDRFGRRLLLTVGASGLAVGLAVMAVVMFLIENQEMKANDNKALKGSFIAGSLLFMSAFSIGVGAIPWLILGEIFDDKVRGTAASIASAVNWSCSFIVTISFEGMRNSMNMYGVMSIYFAFAVGMAIYTLSCVPETKGKSIEEIQATFNKTNKTTPQDDLATNA